MRILCGLMLIMITPVCLAQEFSLIKNKSSSFEIKNDEVSPNPIQQPIQTGPLKISVSAVSILEVEDASIKDTINNKKAVFITGDVNKINKGVLVKLEGSYNNPLLEAYKSPTYFPPITLSTYSDNTWFFVGENGNYTLKIIDLVNNKWSIQYVDIKINNGDPNPGNPNPGNPNPGNPNPGNPNPGNPNPGNPNPGNPNPGNLNLIKISEVTAKLVRELNDKVVAEALYKEYSVALSKLNNQTLAEMRKIMSEARRTAFNNVPSRNVLWNPALIEIDNTIGNIGNTDDYKKAMVAFVEGFKKAIQ